MFKRKLFKRVLPMILSVAMVIQSFPVTVSAAELEQAAETEVLAAEGNDTMDSVYAGSQASDAEEDEQPDAAESEEKADTVQSSEGSETDAPSVLESSEDKNSETADAGKTEESAPEKPAVEDTAADNTESAEETKPTEETTETETIEITETAESALETDTEAEEETTTVSETETETVKEVPDEELNVSVELTSAEAGYNHARVEASVSNPDNQEIEDIGFHITGEDEDCILSGNWKSEDEQTEFYGEYCFPSNVDEVEITPYVKVRISEEDESIEIEGESLTVTRKAAPKLSDVFTNITSQSGGAVVDYRFDAGDIVSKDFWIVWQTKQKGEEEYTTVGNEYVNRNNSESTIYSGSFVVTNCRPNSEYEFLLQLYADINEEQVVLCEQSFSEKTIEVKTYTSEDIPDKTLRALIKNCLDIKEDVFTSEELERISSLHIYASLMDDLGVDSTIKSLEGIQYLTNLQYIDFGYQDIEDISPIAELEYLQRAYFYQNQIKTIPDLQNMKYLVNLSLWQNKIPQSEFNEDKMPSGLLQNDPDWLSQSEGQRGEEVLNVADTYYQLEDGTTLLYFEMDGMRNERKPKVTVKIGNQEYEGEKNCDHGYLIEAKDLPMGSYDAKIIAEENYDGVKLEKAQKINIEELKERVDKQQYMNAESTWIDFQVYIPDTECTLEDVYLVDASDNNRIIALSNYAPNSNIENIRYLIPSDVFMNGWPYLDYQCMRISGGLEVTVPKLSGTYDLIVKTSNKEYQFKDYVVADPNVGVVTYVSYSSNYDNSREYFYVAVSVNGLDYDKFYPELRLDDGTPTTKFVSRIGNVYKLKKLDNFVEEEYTTCKFIAKDGYKVVYDDLHIYTAKGNDLLYISYNGKTKKYIMYTSAEVPENTKMNIRLIQYSPRWNDEEGNWNLENNTIYGNAEVTVNSAETEVKFCDENGDAVVMPRDAYWFYAVDSMYHNNTRIEYTESGFGEVDEERPVQRWAYFSLRLPEPYLKNTKEIPVTLYVYNYEGYIEEGDSVLVNLVNDQGKESIQLTLEKDNKWEQGNRLIGTGIFRRETEYPIGEYSIFTEYYDGIGEDERGGYVYGDETFYQGDQDADVTSYNGQDCVDVYIYTIDPNLEADRFNIEFFDASKQKITESEIIGTSISSDTRGFHFFISGVREKYRIVYVKVTYDGKLGISPEDSTKSYYDYHGYSEEYGKRTTYSTYQGLDFSYREGIGFCGVGWCNVDGDYYIDILDDYDGTLITRFIANGSYEFTQADLQEVMAIDPDLENLYTLVAWKGNKIFATMRGCNIGYRKTDSWSYSIPKTTLSIGETTTVTVAGNKSTPSFTSTNENVFKVVQDSENKDTATITAVGEGTAELQIEADGKIETKEITVTNIKPTGIKLDKSELTVKRGDAFELTASIQPADASGKVKFTSSDENIVKITNADADRPIVSLEALNPGEAVITATIDGTDLSASCKITVEPIIPTGITLPQKEQTIEQYDTFELKATLQPVNASGSVTFTTSDPKVVEITEVDADKLTAKLKAVSLGEAEITATIDGTEYSASCKITVKERVARIRAEKTKTSYEVGEKFGIEDLTVIYSAVDGTDKKLTDKEYTTNASSIDLSKAGKQTLTVTYDDKGTKLTADITITISEKKEEESDPEEGSTEEGSTEEGSTEEGSTEEGSDKDDSNYASDERMDLSSVNANITGIKAEVYDGNAHEPVIKVTAVVGGKKVTLTEGADYRVSYENNVNAGSAKVTVKGNGIYKGSITGQFSINPKQIKKLKIVAGGVAGSRTGSDLSNLPVYVYDNGKLLTLDTDYTLSGYNATQSTAKVTVTGKGNYTGSSTAKLTLYNVSDNMIINPEHVSLNTQNEKYTGKAIKPEPTVTVNGTVLRKNKDYKVQYQNNKNAGTAFVIVTGKGAYKGKAVVSFTITAVTGTFNIKDIAPKTFNGKLQKPSVTVRSAETNKKLSKNKDYTIKYANNFHAGTATVTVVGKGNYAGIQATKTFTISPRDIKKVSVKGAKDNLTVTYSKYALKEGADYEKPVYGTVKSNKIKVTITGKGDFTGQITKNVKLK